MTVCIVNLVDGPPWMRKAGGSNPPGSTKINYNYTKRKMYYTIYKTTNTVNNKIYIGKHQTTDLEDAYLGSGTYLLNAITKYGENKFTKEILHTYESLEEMNDKENELVDEAFIARKDTYNIKIGGQGGFDHVHSSIDLERKRKVNSDKAQAKKWKTDVEWAERYSANISKGKLLFYTNGGINGFKGKTHSKETTCKMSESSKATQTGEKNSQFGTCWIRNEELKENKKITKEDLQIWLDKGWIKGRKVKH